MRIQGEGEPAPSCLGAKGLSWPGGWKAERVYDPLPDPLLKQFSRCWFALTETSRCGFGVP